MGGSESVVRNVDKRTSRREHRVHFEAAVKRFRAAPWPAPPQPEASPFAERDRFVRVCVRKRPIFPHEEAQGEFDVVTCLPGRVVVHDARMHPDMRNMFMNHHDFAFDETFGETCNNDDVYMGTARELVQATLQGRSGTVMMYGQTGSGKTYTMSAIYQRVVTDLFEGVDGREVTANFVELSGDKCFDMLNAGEACNLTQGNDGSVHPFPCVEVAVEDGRDLLALIGLAAKLRATAATGVHDQSSRSHAVCRIFVEGPGGNGEGSLTLVDLAGSEHRIDNSEHNAERRKEGAKINASLAALKDCIRAASNHANFVAFRQNRLTQILRGCFLRQERHQTVVIATVSPSSKDTEHSMNTLRHACIMDGQGEKKSAQSAHMEGGVITKEKLGEIDVAGLARERRAQQKAEGGKLPDSWGQPQAAPAHQAMKSNTTARAALDRKAVRALPAELQRALLASRAQWGSDRQRARIGRAGGQSDEPPATAPVPAVSSAAGVPREPAGAGVGDAEPGPGAMMAAQLGNEALATALRVAGADGERAFELFRLFASRGRQGRDWRKNDLRLISTCVVPPLFGEAAAIDWCHPDTGLDQLEDLLKAVPLLVRMLELPTGSNYAEPGTPPSRGQTPDAGRVASAAAQTPVAASVPARPPRPAARPASGSASERGEPAAGGAEADCGSPAFRTPQGPCREPRKASGGGRNQVAGAAVPPRPEPRARSEGPPVASARGSESPAAMHRVPSASSGASSSRSSGHSHRDAVRARREAMERARKESLQQALDKREPVAQGLSEAEVLERQIAEGGQSAAAMVGLQKRLAAIKAQAVREERAAEARRRQASQPPPIPAPAPPVPVARAALQTPTSRVRDSDTPAGGGSGGRAEEGGAGEEEDFPEPSVPPARGVALNAPSPLAGGTAGGRERVLTACGRPPACGLQAARPAAEAARKRPFMGAAAAPWANSFADEADG